MTELEQAFYLHGIGLEYTGYTGEKVVFSESIRAAILSTMTELNPAHILEQNYQLDVAPWFNLLPETVFSASWLQSFEVKLSAAYWQHTLEWAVYDLAGQTLIAQGQCRMDESNLVGDYFYQGERLTEHTIPTSVLALGYYCLSIKVADQQVTRPLVVYPKTGYHQADQKYWGLSLQLYSVRSQTNLGIGDFADLQILIKEAAFQGADYILLNPLHALFDNEPERASPYSPNDRLCLNPLYIDVLGCDDFKYSTEAQSLFNSDEFQTKLGTEKSQTYIDYKVIFSLKLTLFKLMYRQFYQQHLQAKTSDRAKQFLTYCTTSPRVTDFVNWQQMHVTCDPIYQDNHFSYYLQWLATLQFEQCQQLAKHSGMKIGLVCDLAVGCAGDGNEFEANEAIFITKASIGAPPDPWASHGQNWGLPPLNPHALKASGYAHFIDLIRFNMKHCGALRIDHVMSLLRLWWCLLEGPLKQHGCYVYYPFKELLALLNLESQLNQCAVIGEDLGIVPPEISLSLRDAQIYSNILFYFEKDTAGQFRALSELKPHALLMVANHDVPTFKAWWHGSDLLLRNQLNLFEQPHILEQAQIERHHDKHKMLSWLQQHSECGHLSIESDFMIVYQQLLLTLAGSHVAMITIQLDDLDDNEIPVNIPGTDKEYPNWCRRLNHDVFELLRRHPFLATLRLVREKA